MQREYREALESISVLQRAQLDIVARTLGASDRREESRLMVDDADRDEEAHHDDARLTSSAPAEKRVLQFFAGSHQLRRSRRAVPLKTTEAPRKSLADFELFGQPPYFLTPRETETLKHIMDGLTNKEAGRLMGVSPRTVEVHRANAMSKLGAANTVHLVWIVWNVFTQTAMAK